MHDFVGGPIDVHVCVGMRCVRVTRKASFLSY